MDSGSISRHAGSGGTIDTTRRRRAISEGCDAPPLQARQRRTMDDYSPEDALEDNEGCHGELTRSLVMGGRACFDTPTQRRKRTARLMEDYLDIDDVTDDESRLETGSEERLRAMLQAKLTDLTKTTTSVDLTLEDRRKVLDSLCHIFFFSCIH